MSVFVCGVESGGISMEREARGGGCHGCEAVSGSSYLFPITPKSKMAASGSSALVRRENPLQPKV